MAGVMIVAAMERELSPVEGAIALCCGIGPVEAAVATANALASRSVSVVLHVGIAGAATLAPGTLVIGSESVYSDVLDPQASSPRVARLEAPAELLALARRSLPAAHTLPIATCARVDGGRGFEVEAMEGFGVLRAADAAGVPALEMRAISNLVGEPDRSRWEIDRALESLRIAVSKLVPELAALSSVR